MGFTGFTWVLLGFTGFYWVLPGFLWFYCCFTGFYLVLLGFTWFYWVFLGFTGYYRVLLGFAGFCWVLLGLTGFYWVWSGFTGVFTMWNRVFHGNDHWGSAMVRCWPALNKRQTLDRARLAIGRPRCLLAISSRRGLPSFCFEFYLIWARILICARKILFSLAKANFSWRGRRGALPGRSNETKFGETTEFLT